ncbi:MAG: enoyl-CoA hydratase/isomerase family protein, partial [Candidatus Paceibacterota bacterium]
GGWETMLAFDFRVAASSATFGITQGKFYLPPGWGGISSLSRAVGKPLAMYWLAAQKVIDAQTAFQTGLIQDLFEEEEYEEKLRQLKKKLILNDRPFIEYLKQPRKDSAEEIEPFSRFWESDEHRKRVEEFFG